MLKKDHFVTVTNNEGHNDFWRYLLFVGVIIPYQVICQFVCIFIFYFIFGKEKFDLDGYLNTTDGREFIHISDTQYFIFEFSMFLPLVIGLFFFYKIIFKRSMMTLFTKKKFNLRLFTIAFSLMFVLFGLQFLVDYFILKDGIISFNPTPIGSYLIFTIFAIILIFLQASFEEIVFRGMISTFVGKYTKNIYIILFVTAILFGSAHFFNPEMVEGIWVAVSYIWAGFFFGFIVLRYNSLELSIGIHFANNLFIGLFLNYENSAMPTPSLFLSKSEGTYSFTSFFTEELLLHIIIIIILEIIFRKKNKKNNKDAEI